ncbi:MAG: O-antigen ligase family protein [Lachnospiraceae bacterium]|nr:O-antigen ligase family protein [Lachnospiraceae bacterium]
MDDSTEKMKDNIVEINDNELLNVNNEDTEKNATCREKGIKKSGILYKIGNVSDNVISLLATSAMMILLIIPAFMSIVDLFEQSIDFTLAYYLDVVQIWAFPLVSVMVFIIYLFVFLKLRNENIRLIAVVKRNPIFVIFSIVVLLMVVSQLYNDVWTATHAFYITIVGESFDMEITYFIFILFGATQVRKESHKSFLLRSHLFISALVIITAFVLWDVQADSKIFGDWSTRFSGIFTNTNYIGYYIVIAVPVAAASFVYEKKVVWKLVSVVSFVINMFGLSICNARGAMLGAGFAIAFIVISHLIIEKKINWQTIVIVPAFIVLLIIPSHIFGISEFGERRSMGEELEMFMNGDEAAGSHRLMLWRETLDIIKDYKWLGVGFEGLAVKDVDFYISNGRPHNEFLQYALFHGIPTAIAYFIGCLGVFIRALRKRKIMDGATLVCLSGALGYLVNSFFGLTLFSTTMYLFVFMGLGYARESIKINNGK